MKNNSIGSYREHGPAGQSVDVVGSLVTFEADDLNNSVRTVIYSSGFALFIWPRVYKIGIGA